jgi:hypothetical protein
MQRKVLGLSLAILLCLTAVVQAEPTVVVGDHILLANTAGQNIPISVSGIAANTVNGITLSAMVNDGGTFYGGTPGPTITGMDFDSGPTIWVAPNYVAGHAAPATFFDNQLASANFLIIGTALDFLPAGGGLVATLTIDTTGFGPGVYSLKLFGPALEDNVNNTDFIGQNFLSSITNGTITIVPEPSSVVLGLFAVAGLGAVAIRKRRARRA